jgi:hypothetical protein
VHRLGWGNESCRQFNAAQGLSKMLTGNPGMRSAFASASTAFSKAAGSIASIAFLIASASMANDPTAYFQEIGFIRSSSGSRYQWLPAAMVRSAHPVSSHSVL